MKSLRIFLALVTVSWLGVLATHCGDDDGGNNQQEICNNSIDDDGDLLVDCADPDCTASPYCATCNNDGICQSNENATSCPADCGTTNPCNNNGTCETAAGENATNCLADCHCGNGTCEANLSEDASSCSADCNTTGGCDTVDDLAAQTGCGNGEKCAIVDQNGGVDCVTAGTVGAWQTCTYTNALDDCQAGYYCGEEDQGSGTTTCIPYCDDDNPCPQGSTCSIDMQVATGVSVNICAQSDNCDVVDNTGCTSGSCYIASTAGDTSCFSAGTAVEGAGCYYQNDCVGGMVCMPPSQGAASVCTRLCYDNTDCTTGTCQGVGQVFSQLTTVGICAS